jgi:hypothetical protein
MKLQDLLKGQTAESQQALDAFFADINEERILWYPSAGRDYRDVMEMHSERLALHQIPEAPNIICHTDYNLNGTGLNQLGRTITIRLDKRTNIRVVEKHELNFVPNSDIHFNINNENISEAPDVWVLMVFLLKLRIQSDMLGAYDAYVFYFIFENYNFLEELILKKQLAITHFVKVRQGCGFGGCRKCVSVFYSLLANIGVKYLLVDAEVWFDLPTHHRLALRHRIKHKNYRLDRIGVPLRWSDYHVQAFRVEPLPGNLNNDSLNASLAAINKGWSDRDPCQAKSFFR